MNDPKLYSEVNSLQRHDDAELINDFFPKLQWRSDGLDALIDVGSASGDVLMDFIYPKMPQTFQRLVCSDINENMVKYAKLCYQHLPNTEYEVLDIGTKRELDEHLKGQFDHVTSFLCLQFVQDQRQAFQNIYNLLRPEGGDCLLTCGLCKPFFAGYTCLSKNPKWLAFMNDIDEYTSPYQCSKDPEQDVIQILQETGFRDYIIELRDSENLFKLEDFRIMMKSVSPYIHRIPVEEHDMFIDDLIDAMNHWDRSYQFWNRSNNTVRFRYQNMIIYAKRTK